MNSSGDDMLDLAFEISSEHDSLSDFLGSKTFKNSVIGIVAAWAIKTLVLEPAALTFGFIDWAVGGAIATVDGAVRGALRGAGEPIWAAFLGPTGAVTVYQETLVGLATDAGIAAPVATGAANLVLLVLVGGGLYLLGRAVAGYLTGGVLS